MALNYEEIERALATMTTRSRLYAIVKKEMKIRGRWRDHPRGIGFKPGKDERRITLKPVDK